MGRTDLVCLLAIVTCCFCQKNTSRSFPAVVSGSNGECPSAEERAAIREQIRQQLSLIPLIIALDCCQVKEFSPLASNGTYNISSCNSSDAFATTEAYCDMETDGGGWLVIQRRINGSVDFYRNWTDYVSGFGDLEGEFWYGLENIHCLTTREDVELRIEVGNETTPSIVWTYQLFRVGGAETNYVLTIGEGQGNGRDSMAIQNGRPFSTRDRDNDNWVRNCAAVFGGAWWYRECLESNLNGNHNYHTPEDGLGIPATSEGANRLVWWDGSSWQNSHYTMAEMKIRPKRAGTSNN